MSYTYNRGQKRQSRYKTEIDELRNKLIGGYTYGNQGRMDEVVKQISEGLDDKYISQYQNLIDNAQNKYLNSEFKFSYDPNADEGFQKYAAMLRNEGALAMEDTIGKITASTGGYGNSYAQTAGQAVYNDYADQIGAAQASFSDKAYEKALDKYVMDQEKLLAEIDMYKDKETQAKNEWNSRLDPLYDELDLLVSDKESDLGEWGAMYDKLTALEAVEAEDIANWEAAYNEDLNGTLASGDIDALAEILGVSDNEAMAYYNDYVNENTKPLTDAELDKYWNAIMNGDEIEGDYYEQLRKSGYNVSDVVGALNAYAQANNLGMSIGKTSVVKTDARSGGVVKDENGNIVYDTKYTVDNSGYSHSDINDGIKGLDNLDEGQKFHIQMHDKEHGQADNINVQLGGKIDSATNRGVYNNARAAGEGLFAYGNDVYYYDGITVYKVNAQNNKQDEYTQLLKLLKAGKGRAGAKDF